ncbi:MAG: type II toxin-antitoxin system RelE/ParE family toxin [Emticicia sp.]|nr:type II toxin-antitoxin system RelE/ParE family toxin [Emticicia sp.]
MKFAIITTEDFKRDFKRLFKKYPSLIDDVENLKSELENAPQQGEPLGKDCYKIRMAISSKGQGKSGGARLIASVKIIKEKIYLIAIYDKSDMENISDKELKERLKGIK